MTDVPDDLVDLQAKIDRLTRHLTQFPEDLKAAQRLAELVEERNRFSEEGAMGRGPTGEESMRMSGNSRR